jgi:hypothetical protein
MAVPKDRLQTALAYIQLLRNEQELEEKLKDTRKTRREMERTFQWIGNLKGLVRGRAEKASGTITGEEPPEKRKRKDPKEAKLTKEQIDYYRLAKNHRNQIKMKMTSGRPINEDLVTAYLDEIHRAGEAADSEMIEDLKKSGLLMKKMDSS